MHPGSLVPAPGSSAPGHVIDVDDDELAVLDRFEGALAWSAPAEFLAHQRRKGPELLLRRAIP